MASQTHARSRSKGSFSIFSLDTIRSLSRAGSRQASRIPSKDELRPGAESSLSHQCDPNNQPPATPELSFNNVGPEDSVKTQSPAKGNGHDHDKTAQAEPQGASHRFDSIRSRANRLRPKSWLSLSRSAQRASYPRSTSTQLPKTASTSTVAQSVISAPILTSTTNAAVARTENVHCGEISDTAFAQSTWNSQVGWVATADQTPNQTASDTVLSPVSEDKFDRPGSGLLQKKGRMVRLKNVIRSKLRHGAMLAPQPRPIDEVVEEPEHNAGHLLKRHLSRRRAETINLYKGKIRELTGSGHIRRKSLNNTKGSMESKYDEGPPLLGGDIIDTSMADSAAEHSDNESPFGSFTKSVSSAVDKLEFYSAFPRNISFLRSRSSFLSLKKGDKDTSSAKEVVPQFPPISPSRPAPPVSQPVAAPAQSNPQSSEPQGSSSTQQSMMPQHGIPTLPAMPNRPNLGSAQNELARRRSGPFPVVFSNATNGYVASAPVPGYPRGVNPLRMHPPDTFAVPPTGHDQSTSVMPAERRQPPSGPSRQVTAANTEMDTDSDSASLEDAPIYSPSLGDLSQYARSTPRSVNFAVPEGGQGQSLNPTPTRSPAKTRWSAKGQPGLLKKSRSGISLFSRSKHDAAVPRLGAGGGALNDRDTNQKIGTDSGKMVKKSKSLHFGALFKRDEQNDLAPTMSSSPFQPATPSPLRKVTRYDSQSTKGGSSPTTLSTKK